MQTSLNNIKAIDDYILRCMTPADAVLFEAKILLSNDLKDDVKYQRTTHAIIRQYGRQSIKAEIRAVQQTLTTSPQYSSFMQRIINFFKK